MNVLMNGDKKVCSITNDLMMMLEIVLFESGSGVGDVLVS